MKPFNPHYQYLQEMYDDSYYPNPLVNKLKATIIEVVLFLEKENHSLESIQTKLDEMTRKINDLQEEFGEADSEIETVARDSIAVTIEYILQYFNIDLDLEAALRERDW